MTKGYSVNPRIWKWGRLNQITEKYEKSWLHTYEIIFRMGIITNNS
jgi:hypothetical protein